MGELLGKFGWLLKKEDPMPLSGVEKGPRVFNPVADPNRARLLAFLTPGVINGTIETPMADGSLHVINFDIRDRNGQPTYSVRPRT